MCHFKTIWFTHFSPKLKGGAQEGTLCSYYDTIKLVVLESVNITTSTSQLPCVYLLLSEIIERNIGTDFLLLILY